MRARASSMMGWASSSQGTPRASMCAASRAGSKPGTCGSTVTAASSKRTGA